MQKINLSKRINTSLQLQQVHNILTKSIPFPFRINIDMKGVNKQNLSDYIK